MSRSFGAFAAGMGTGYLSTKEKQEELNSIIKGMK